MSDRQSAPGIQTQHSDSPPSDSMPELLPGSNVGALFKQALQLHRLGHWEAASFLYEQVIAAQGHHHEALHMSGVVALQMHLPELSLARIDQALVLSPRNAKMLFHRGVALEKLRRLEDAICSYDRAIALCPDYVQALVNRGVAYKELGQWDLAIGSFEQAIAYDRQCVPAYVNLGNAQSAAKRWSLALNSYREAMALDPTSENAPIYLAKALRMLGRIPEAIALCERVLVKHPDSVLAHWNLAHLLLLSGLWHQGWPHYEWRWHYAENAKYQRSFPQPRWDGLQSLTGKTLLLHHEQGLGDTIQFCRYASLCSLRGARVLLEVPRSLVDLMQGLEGIHAVLERSDSPPAFDYHCPLMSLPGIFATSPHSTPGTHAYLRASSIKEQQWQERLAAVNKFKVGIVWSGGVRADQEELNQARNIPLAQLAQALRDVDVALFSLQKGELAEAELRGREESYWPNGNFYNFTDAIDSFDDTAGILAHMDLVISVDTSTLHLAAALGRPTWLLNKYETCWRWLLDRDTSPWYPTLKIYRQDARMDWTPVLKRVASDLVKTVETANRTPK